MAEFSYFWDGTTVGDAGSYDSASLMRMQRVTLQGVTRANAGVLYSSGDGTNSPLKVAQTSPATSSVRVRKGSAMVTGYYYETDAEVTVAIPANNNGSGWARIDRIVVRWTASAQTVRIALLQGTAAASPVAPALTQNTATYEIPLAQIAVANLFSTIVDANITDEREPAIKLHTEHGGTGISTYTKGDVLAGESAASLQVLPVGSNNQIIIADSAEDTGLKWATNGLTPLVLPTALGGSSASITISSIPATYHGLLLICSLKTDRASNTVDNVNLRMNGDTGNNYSYQYSQANGAAVSAAQLIGTNLIFLSLAAAAATSAANYMPSLWLWISEYANTGLVTTVKGFITNSLTNTGGLSLYDTSLSARWQSTAAVTSLALTPALGTNFVTGSVYSLYGVGPAI